MNYDGFINKYLGQAIDFDGMYGPQCVDEVARYCVDNGMPVAYANAKDWWGHPALAGAFDFIQNNPDDYNQYPSRGDIIIWDGGLPNSGGYGHIAIFDMVVSPGVFQSLDQNWGGQYVHFVPNHNWNYIIGWLHPKTPPTPPPAPAPLPAPVDNTPYPAPNVHPDPAPAPVDTPVTVPEPGTVVEPIPTLPVPDPVIEYNDPANTLLRRFIDWLVRILGIK